MDSYSATVTVAPDGESTVSVAGRITIEHAAEVRERLLEALGAAGKVHLDLQGVEEIDLIGLQLICALHRSASAQGKFLRVTGGRSRAVEGARCAAGFQERPRCSKELNSCCVWSSAQ